MQNNFRYSITDNFSANNGVNKAIAVFVLEFEASVDLQLTDIGISANTTLTDPLTNMTYSILQLAVIIPSSEHE